MEAGLCKNGPETNDGRAGNTSLMSSDGYSISSNSLGGVALLGRAAAASFVGGDEKLCATGLGEALGEAEACTFGEELGDAVGSVNGFVLDGAPVADCPHRHCNEIRKRRPACLQTKRLRRLRNAKLRAVTLIKYKGKPQILKIVR